MSKTLDGTGRLLGLTVDPNDTNVNKLIVSSTTSSGSSTTGALTVAGGVGIAGNLNVGGSITGGSISYASTTTGTLAVTNTTDSTSTTTGVLTVAGGVGIAKQVFVGSNTDITGRLSVGYAASKEALLNLGKSGTYGSRSAYIYQSATGNMEINNQENGDLLLSTNNGGKMIIKPDGKVGIGTTTPSNQLEVVGSANITGTIGATSFTAYESSSGVGTPFTQHGQSTNAFYITSLGHLHIPQTYIRHRNYLFGLGSTVALSWNSRPIQVNACNTGQTQIFKLPDPSVISVDGPNPYGVSFLFINYTDSKTIIQDYTGTSTIATLYLPNDSCEVFLVDTNLFTTTYLPCRKFGSYTPYLYTLNATQTTSFTTNVGTYTQTGNSICITFSVSGNVTGVGTSALLLLSIPAFSSFLPIESKATMTQCAYNGTTYNLATCAINNSPGVGALELVIYTVSGSSIVGSGLTSPPNGVSYSFQFQGTITYSLKLV